MSGASPTAYASEMRSKGEIPVKLRFGRDDGARTFLQIGLNLFLRSVCGLVQRDAVYNRF
jgi:hypothetical protein